MSSRPPLLTFLRALLPQRQRRFPTTATPFQFLFFPMPFHFPNPLLFPLHFPSTSRGLQSLLNTGRMSIPRRSNGPRPGAPRLRNGQTQHFRVNKTNLAVKKILNRRKQTLRRIQPCFPQLNDKRDANMLCLQTHTRHLAQRYSLRRLLCGGAKRGSAQQKQPVAHFAAKLLHKLPHLRASIESIILHLNKPQFLLARVVENKIHLLATVAKILRMVRIKGGTLATANIIPRFKVKAMHPLHTTGSYLKHNATIPHDPY